MDFFGAQDRARRKTILLVGLFAAAVCALVIATNILIALVAGFSNTAGIAEGVDGVLARTPIETWLSISLLVVFVIAAASLYKYFTLRSGGRAIADLLGGKQIDPASADLRERRLLNVVEEMAIASGIPVPPVYLLEEGGINAFAAGLGTDDAIIGVTRGTLESLDREELQGVIGHEFSHILNGDTRMNLRLIAILHGILFLGLLGEIVLRSGGRSRRNKGGAAVVAMGIGLLVIGYAGTFFGNLIKAAVNRQREFLADAASVQFTRNPSGIADALKKIGGSTTGSKLDAPHTKEVSHLFFGQAISFAINGLFATHPPLGKRIRAVEPGWNGEFASTRPPASSVAMRESLAMPEAAIAMHGGIGDIVVAQVGKPDRHALEGATQRIEALPELARVAAREPASARALIYALFLAADPRVRDRQLEDLHAAIGATSVSIVIRLQPACSGLDEIAKLTLVTLAAPALKAQSKEQYESLVANVVTLVRTDQRVDLIEWVLHRILLHELAPHYRPASATPQRNLSAVEENASVSVLLSALARAARSGAVSQERAFAGGANTYGQPLVFDRAEDANFERLNGALRRLRALPPLNKPRIIKACAVCVLCDGVESGERALLAGIAATLDCPLPPDFRVPPT